MYVCSSSNYINLLFFPTDIRLVAAIRAPENYGTLSNGFRHAFNDINKLIADPSQIMNDEVFKFKFYICSHNNVGSYSYSMP